MCGCMYARKPFILNVVNDGKAVQFIRFVMETPHLAIAWTSFQC